MHIDLSDDRRTSRLSVVHFLLWLAVAAVLAVQATVPFRGDVLLTIAINSAAITAALVAIYQATRDAEWVDAHPGHWLAMVVLWVYLDQWLITPQLMDAAPRHKEEVYSVFYLGAALLMFVGMLLGDWGKVWKLALGAHGLVFLLAGGWRIVEELSGWQSLAELIRDYLAPPVDVLAVVLVLFAVLHDFWWRDLRDWKHWVGLVWFAFHWSGTVQAYVAGYLAG